MPYPRKRTETLELECERVARLREAAPTDAALAQRHGVSRSLIGQLIHKARIRLREAMSTPRAPTIAPKRHPWKGNP